jgi:hypothetical protein
MTLPCNCCMLLELSCQRGLDTGILSTVNISSPFSCPWLLDKHNIGKNCPVGFKKELVGLKTTYSLHNDNFVSRGFQ